MKNRRRNRFLLSIAGIISLVFVLSGCSGEYFAEVNGTKLLVSDLNRKCAAAEKAASEYYQEQGQGQVLSEAEKKAFRNNIANDVMVAYVLIKEDLEANNWSTNNSEVNDRIKELKDQMGRGVFQTQLNGLGMTEKEFRLNWAHQYYVTEGMTVTEEEARAQNPLFGETVKARHILIMTQQEGVDNPDAKPDEEAKAEAQDILDRLNNGEDFEALAKEKSQDDATKESGGVYDNIYRGMMVQEFDDTVFSLQPGERSDLVKTTYGYHIIEVLEQKPPKTREEISQEQWDQAEMLAKQVKYEEYYKVLLEEADITFASGYEDLDRDLEPTAPEPQQTTDPEPGSDSEVQNPESAVETEIEPIPEEEAESQEEVLAEGS